MVFQNIYFIKNNPLNFIKAKMGQQQLGSSMNTLKKNGVTGERYKNQKPKYVPIRLFYAEPPINPFSNIHSYTIKT